MNQEPLFFALWSILESLSWEDFPSAIVKSLFAGLAASVVKWLLKRSVSLVTDGLVTKPTKKISLRKQLASELVFIGAISLAALALVILISSAQSRPRSLIRGKVRTCSIGPGSGPNGTTNTYVLVTMRLANSGSPTGIWNWKLEIQPPYAQPIEAAVWDRTMPDAKIVTSDPSSLSGLYLPDKYLPIRLFDRAIGDGGGTEGWAMFSIDGMKVGEITQRGTKFIIEVEQTSDGSRRKIEHIFIPGQ